MAEIGIVDEVEVNTLAEISVVAGKKKKKILFPHIIDIGGNIGVGKSTTGDDVANAILDNGLVVSRDRIIRLLEPIERWEKYLKVLYEKNATAVERRDALCGLQMEVLVYQFETMRTIDNAFSKKTHDFIIIERSPFETTDIFLQINREHMREDDYDALVHLMRRQVINCSRIWSCFEKGKFNPHATHIFIDQTPDECIRRIRQRSRASEVQENSTLNEEYIQVLGRYYKSYISTYFDHNARGFLCLDPEADRETRLAAIMKILH
jgi:deoxyadenosine/deoxycytidine kinase